MAELAPIISPEAVPHAVAAALGVAPNAARTRSDALVDALRSRQLLLVVDNCEHVLDAVSRLVEALARRCPKLTVVATSRERLAIGGEHVWRVLPLPVPPPGARGQDLEASHAVALFVDRARAARADFCLNDANTDAVADICRGLDGLPLALEIAAARLGVLTPPDMAGRLRERFALLTAGPRGEGDRHRTLRALVDWSYGLLDEPERAVFARLSVFAGGWTLDAAATVCARDTVSAAQVGGLVASLADKSMVVPLAAAGPGRYGILETLRLYGAERLNARGETESTRGAHARHFVALAEEAEAGLRGTEEAEWVRRLRVEIDNLRAAHVWSRESGAAGFALRLSAVLHRFACWQANDEVLSWAEAAVELPAARGHPLLPVVVGSAAVRRMHRGEMIIAAEYANRALADCAGHDDPRRALPTEALAGTSLLTGRLDEAFELYGEAVRLWRLAGDDEGVVWSLCGRAVSAAKNGHLSTAVGLSEEAWQVAAAAGSSTMKAHVLYSQGESLLEVDLGPVEGGSAMSVPTAVEVLDQITGSYQPDPAHSRIGFAARHAMVTTVHGWFDSFQGRMHLDGHDPSNCSVALTIDAASIRTNNPDRDAHLCSADFLDVERYPTLTFESSGVMPLDDRRYRVTGDLTHRLNAHLGAQQRVDLVNDLARGQQVNARRPYSTPAQQRRSGTPARE